MPPNKLTGTSLTSLKLFISAVFFLFQGFQSFLVESGCNDFNTTIALKFSVAFLQVVNKIRFPMTDHSKKK